MERQQSGNSVISPRENEPLLGETGYDTARIAAGHYHLDMKPTIYSAIVYGPLTHRVRTGEGYFHKGMAMICSMILLNMIIQLGLLRIMTIYVHRDSQELQVVALQSRENVRTYESFLAPIEQDAVGRLDDREEPLCTKDENGTYSCMPSSIRFASRWESLDTNQDGVWSIDEALSLVASTNMSTSESTKQRNAAKWQTVYFNSMIQGLKQSAERMEQLNGSLYLSQDVLNSRAIPKAYYEFWTGDVMLCTRFDSNACENIVAAGLFDAALEHGSKAAAHKGIFDYSSAATYCKMMLENGGGCEKSLPDTFKREVLNRKHMCGPRSIQHGEGVVTDPHNPTKVMVVMSPSYKYLEQQLHASHPTFLFFTVLIMFLFYASLVDEVRDLIKTVDFLLCFPGVNGPDDYGGIDRGENRNPDKKRYIIQRLSVKHRSVLTILTLVRIIIVTMLITFGTRFLLAEKSYLELVMNALALSFITGVDEMMFEVFMESAEKSEIGFDDCERISYHGLIPRDNGSVGGFLFRKDVWGLLLLPAASIAVVVWFDYHQRQPTVTAMTCACTQEGQHCAESMMNQASWWSEYWTRTLPAAIHQIEALRLQGA